MQIGDALGLYRTLHANGPMISGELAEPVPVSERYVCEWLANQAASGYLAYDPATGKFVLPEEQAMVFSVQDSPVYSWVRST